VKSLQSEVPAVILVTALGWSGLISGFDIYDCMLILRERLESDGYLLCIQGARPYVNPSGMLRQVANGWLAYALRPGELASDDDLVDIFAGADCGQVVSVAEQKQTVASCWRDGTRIVPLTDHQPSTSVGQVLLRILITFSDQRSTLRGDEGCSALS
jgi:hypothetical protein